MLFHESSQRPLTATEPIQAVAARPRIAPAELRLRISLGGGTPRRWRGQISIADDAAKFESLAQLGLNQQANAAIQLRDNTVWIEHVDPSGYNAIDVTVRGVLDAKLTVDLTDADDDTVQANYTVKLIDVLQQPSAYNLDAAGNGCSIGRAPGDPLRVEVDRPHLIFQPDEPLVLSLAPNLTAAASTILNCRLQITAARQAASPTNAEDATRNAVLWRKHAAIQTDVVGSASPTILTIPTPTDEGVYDLHIEAQTARFQAGASASPDRLVRKVQFVVLTNEPADASDALSATKAWQPLLELTADDLLSTKSPAWPHKLTKSLKRMTQRRRGGSLDQPCLGNQGRKLVAATAGDDQRQLQLSPGGWQAIPITVRPSAEPCLIEIDYATGGGDNDELALGVSLLKPDASGQISPLGQDSGVFLPAAMIPDAGSDDNSPRPARTARTARTHTHRIYHWPTDRTAWLVLANRHADHDARIAAVRVLAGTNGITANAARDPASTDAQLAPRRQAMAFFEAPKFPETFGASKSLDSSIGQPLDDWVTFYQGAQRLIQYLKANGKSGAFITVAADGSSIYPSHLMQPGPRYDNGAFQWAGQDPLRKDVVELLFRMFQRESLQLVPVLAMNAALPALEQPPAGRLVNYGGQIAAFDSDGALPRYNPLDPAVQQAVTAVVEEFATRYQGHDNFRRLAITCRPDTYTLLPGQQWGNDAATIQRFLDQATEIVGVTELNQLEPVAQVAELLGRFREPWLTWRANRMATWYGQMRDALQSVVPSGQLVLAPIDLYRNAETSAALNPALHTSNDFAAIMLQMGFDASWATNDPRHQAITLLAPHRIAPAEPLASRRVDWHVDRSPLATDFFQGGRHGGQLFVHRSDWIHFAQLQQQPPMADQRSPLMRRQPMTLGGPAARQRFVQAIRDTDSRLLVDGGKTLATGQEESVAELHRVFGQLPDVPFQDVAVTEASASSAADALPVVVRQTTCDNQSYFYAANASPWPMQVTCVLATDRGSTQFESFSDTQLQSKKENAEGHGSRQVVFSLKPWSLAGGRAADANVKLSSYSVAFPADADIHLRKQVYRLQSLLVQSAETPPLEGLSNPGFEATHQPAGDQTDEATTAPMPVGWTSNGFAGNGTAGNGTAGNGLADEGVRLNQDAAAANEGRHFVTMFNQQSSPVWIRSNEFAAPETGRLSVSVWLKTDQPDQPLPLRISLEGNVAGTNYYRFGSIGSLSPNPQSNQVSDQWQRFAVHFDDLPLENLDRLRIGFDLMGPGRVMIDQVLIHDRWFDENDSKAITQLLASASTLLSSPDTYDRARRLLDGYWPQFLIEHFRDATGNHVDPNHRADQTAAAPRAIDDRASVSEDTRTLDRLAPRAAEAPKQGFLRLRNVFGPRKPQVR